MSETSKRVSKPLALLVALVTASFVLVATQRPEPAEALTGSEFDPGLIISDELFYDGSAMTAAEIQSFLDGKIGTCLTDRCLNVAVLPVTGRPASYSVDTGGLVCTQIIGGNLTAAELIYRTQVACSISAKVILVTLQKEQGLVTSRAPSDWALRAAMGMGCPDTAPCSDAFAGLATQIMSGTRQLAVYKIGGFGRQPGRQYVQYHPNASCGGTTVEVANYATAALYNYTPYQPNAAALANLGTTGDSCSSYGNRNFWSYYNNWFGSTKVIACTANPTREITRHWTELGGASSPLGDAVSPGIVPGAVGTTIGYYANGAIYCSPKVGPYSVVGAVATAYAEMGGPASALGSPIRVASTLTANGISGVLQEFQKGTMLSSATSGTFAVLHGPIRDAWGARGGSGGSLGWPTGSQESMSGGVRQQFQNGMIVIPNGRAAVVMTGAIGTYWTANAAALGMPDLAAKTLTAGGVSGSVQDFANGMVLSSAEIGTFAVYNGGMRDAWGRLGGTGGTLGWPIADRAAVAGGFAQEFQRGTVVSSASGGGALSGDIASYWKTGTNATLLGLPTTSPSPWTAGGVSGTLQYFDRGMVLSSASTGTHAVLDGPIRDAWGKQGGSGGRYGWPTGSQQSGSQVSQQFQGGVIAISTGLTGDIGTYWSTGSNGSRLGPSTGSPMAWTAGGASGTLQYFQRGMVLSASTTGTFAVLNGAIRDAWGSAGGSGGSLGWPTGDQQSVSGGIRQQFQHGFVMVQSNGGVVVSSGAIADYWAQGSNAAKLGAPTSSPAAWTAGGVSGTLQYFQRGMVLSSTTTGTYAVLDGQFRTAWGNAGGSGGPMGWPTGDQQAVPGGIRQQFERGFITVPTGGTAVVLSGVIASYWSTGSNGAALGAPTASPASWTAGGVSGTLQYFQRGMVLSSTATGTFSVLEGPIRMAWGTAGGSGGSLGWPTGDQIANAGGVQQSFQRGVIFVSAEGLAYALSNDYFTYWSASQNASALGGPVDAVVSWMAGGVTGSYQVFERGMIMSSSTTGTYAVLNGAVRDLWGSLGGSGGSLGWPTGDPTTVPEGVRQQFQRGAIIVPTSGFAYVVT